MANQKPIMVVINTDFIRDAVKYYYSPMYSTEPSVQIDVEDILHLIGNLAPYCEDEVSLDLMAQDIADSMEIECHKDYSILVTVLIQSANYIKHDLGKMAKIYPDLSFCLSELKGNSAYFLME